MLSTSRYVNSKLLHKHTHIHVDVEYFIFGNKNKYSVTLIVTVQSDAHIEIIVTMRVHKYLITLSYVPDGFSMHMLCGYKTIAKISYMLLAAVMQHVSSAHAPLPHLLISPKHASGCLIYTQW